MPGIENPLRCLLVLPHLLVKISGKLQLNSGRGPNSPDTSEMKFSATPPGKNPKGMRCLVRTKGMVINTRYTHTSTAEMRTVIVN